MKHKFIKKTNKNIFLIISIALLIGCGIYLYTQSAIIKESLIGSAGDAVYGLIGTKVNPGVNDYLGDGQALIKAAMSDVDKTTSGTPGEEMQPRMVLLLTDYQTFLNSLQKYTNDFTIVNNAQQPGNAMYNDYMNYFNSLSSTERRTFAPFWYNLKLIYNASVSKNPIINVNGIYRLLDSLLFGVSYLIPAGANGLPLISVNSSINYGNSNSSNTFITSLKTALEDLVMCNTYFKKLMSNVDFDNRNGTTQEYDVEYTFINKYNHIGSVKALNTLLIAIRQAQLNYHWKFEFMSKDKVPTNWYWLTNKPNSD